MKLNAFWNNRMTWLSFALMLCIVACSTSRIKTTAETSTKSPTTDPSIPDYSNSNAWAAHPNAPGASAKLPLGMTKSDGTKDVDVFYIHPTVFRSETEYNQRIDNDSLNALIDASVIARQASVFNDCCQVYAPRYRAASFLATADRFLEGRGAEAYDHAYSDLLRAFDHFRKQNKDRPFIIAGHSQGGLMVSRLLKDRIDNTPAQEQMIAAYALGYNLSKGEFGRKYKTLQPCDRPLQTGCVLCWNAVTPEANLDLYLKMGSELYVRTYETEEDKEMLCINPLTFDSSKPDADRSWSKGAVPGIPGIGEMEALQANKLSASVQKGFLVVDLDSSLNLSPLPGGSLHYHEFGMFYEDIRQNVAARIAEFKIAKVGQTKLSIESQHTDKIELLVSYPINTKGDFPLIVFSHGNGLDANGYNNLTNKWVAQGYVVVAPNHLDSGGPEVASAAQKKYGSDWVSATRVLDLEESIKQIDFISKQLPNFNGTVNSENVIAAGHSFGALSAQILAGATLERQGNSEKQIPKTLSNEQVVAVVAISPPGLIPNFLSKKTWAAFNTPQLVVTGTNDISPPYWPTYDIHLVSYESAMEGNNYLVVLDGADHFLGNLIGDLNRDEAPQELALQNLIEQSLTFINHYSKPSKANKLNGLESVQSREGIVRFEHR